VKTALKSVGFSQSYRQKQARSSFYGSRRRSRKVRKGRRTSVCRSPLAWLARRIRTISMWFSWAAMYSGVNPCYKRTPSKQRQLTTLTDTQNRRLHNNNNIIIIRKFITRTCSQALSMNRRRGAAWCLHGITRQKIWTGLLRSLNGANRQRRGFQVRIFVVGAKLTETVTSAPTVSLSSTVSDTLPVV